MRALVYMMLLLTLFAAATTPMIVAETAVEPMSGQVRVALIATNDSAAPRPFEAPAELTADLAAPNGNHQVVSLRRDPAQPAMIMLPSAGFARLRYTFILPEGSDAGVLALTLPGAPAIALTYKRGSARTAAAPPLPTPGLPSLTQFDRPAAEESGRSGFLANLTTYEPIYAVYGPGTNTDARIQISLKYQFFGTPGVRGSWADGIMFGYTQQMFWDLGRDSAPFRDVSYIPELYYALPKLADLSGWAIAGRVGLRHQSNGRSGTASRSFNILYVEPEATTALGRYDVAFGPRAWAYAGRRTGNTDIAHYRGNVGAFVRVGTKQRFQLDLTGRINPGNGKGAAEGLLSYPLTTVWASGPKLYLFAQGFAGYGEDILDYNRRQTRLRAGIGLTR